MNCLLVMPNTLYDNEVFTEYYHFPLGIGYISAVMKKVPGIRVTNLNMNQAGRERHEIIRDWIRRHEIDMVLTGGLCTLYPRIREILEAAKQERADIVTVVGGGVVSGDPEAAMSALEFADYGVIGEGERTIDELCRALRDHGDPGGVKGLIYRRDGDWVLTGVREEIRDLGQIPWCDYEGFGFREYLGQRFNLSYENHERWQTAPTLSMLSSRSCPHKCTFCFHPEGGVYRQRDLDDVFAELTHLVHEYQPQSIAFVDEMIGMSQANLEKFCRGIQRFNLPWTTSFRVCDITGDKVRLLKKANCQGIFLGLESASDKILRSMRKGTTVTQIENALRISAEERLFAQGNFIFGDPEETYDTCMETLEWYLAHPQYSIALVSMMYYPGTEIYWRAVRSGKISDRVQYVKNNAMQINCTKMSEAEYLDIVRVKIPEYKTRRYQLLPELQDAVLRVKDGELSLTGRCRCCSTKLEFHKLSPIAVHDPLLCGSCATLHSAAPFKNQLQVRNNITYLIDTFGKIAFWGIGVVFRTIMDPELVQDPRIFLVDRARAVLTIL